MPVCPDKVTRRKKGKKTLEFQLQIFLRFTQMPKVYLNIQIWSSILAVESLIFRQTFFPQNVLVNFRLKKCYSQMKTLDYFGSYLLVLIKKVFMKHLKFLLLSTYVAVTLTKCKLQTDPVNPTNPDILKFIMKFLWIKCL